MSKRLIALLAGALAISLVAAGCGGSDDGSTVSTSSLTKAAFIKKADAICDKAESEVEGEVEAYAKENGIPTDTEPNDEAKEELVVEVIVPNVEKQASDISALGAPSGDEDQVGDLIEGLESAASEAADDPSAVFNGDADPFEGVNEEAREYGFKVCGEG